MAGNWLTAIASVVTSLIPGAKIDRKPVTDVISQLSAAEFGQLRTIMTDTRNTFRGTLDADGKHFIGLGRNATNPLTGTLLTEVGSGLYLDNAGALWLVYNGGAPVRFGVASSIIRWEYTNGFGNGTVFVESFGAAATEVHVIKVPFACTIRKLYVRAGTAPGTAHQIVFTVRQGVGAGGAMADTALTCTLTSAGVNASDLSNSVSFAAGDSLAVKMVGSGTGSAEANIVVSVEVAS